MIAVMPNTGLAIELQPAERTRLEQWESAHGTPQQVALRCRIILRAVAGQQNVAIAAGLGVSRPTVQLWRKRVHEQGIGKVWEIAPGRGRKAHYDQGQRDRIIQATLQSKRSEERRVGKECRSGWWREQEKKKKTKRVAARMEKGAGE